MPNLTRTSRCAVSSALLLALAMTVAQTVTAQTAPAALQPSESHHTVATLSATGVQIYVCKRDGDKPDHRAKRERSCKVHGVLSSAAACR